MRVLLLAGAFVLAGPVAAKDVPEVTWDPIDESHWAEDGSGFTESPAAVIVFERVLSDETRLDHDECILELRQRIKVLRHAGSAVADVEVPFSEDAGKVRRIAARSVHPDGRVFTTSPGDILHGIALVTKAGTMKKRTVVVPGVEPGCLIDLYVEFESKEMNPVWETQRDLPLRHGSFIWRFWHATLGGEAQVFLNAVFAPNFVWVAPPEGYWQHRRTTENEFGLENVPARRPVPFGMESGKQPMLLMYYGSSGSDRQFWMNMAEGVRSWLREEADVGKLDEWAAEVRRGSTKSDRIAIAYRIVTSNLAADDEAVLKRGRKSGIDAKGAVKRKRGASIEIAMCLWRVLSLAGVEAEPAFLRDRRTGAVIAEAKFFQFNRMIVLARDDARNVICLAPGEERCAAGELPWYLEGMEAFVVEATSFRFAKLARSSPAENNSRIDLDLSLKESDALEGTLRWTRRGHRAWEGRQDYEDLDAASCQRAAEAQLEAAFPRAVVTGVVLQGAQDPAQPLDLSANVRFPSSVGRHGNLRAIRLLALTSDEFQTLADVTHDQPVETPYPFSDSTNVRIRLPDGARITLAPAPVEQTGYAGLTRTEFLVESSTLVATHVFQVDHAFYEAKHTQLLEDLYRRQVRSLGAVVVME